MLPLPLPPQYHSAASEPLDSCKLSVVAKFLGLEEEVVAAVAEVLLHLLEVSV
jgi:hypothetical protein